MRNGNHGRMSTADPNSGDRWRGESRNRRIARKTAAIASGNSHHGARSATRTLAVPTRPMVPSEHQIATPAQRAAGNPFR
jgi:hypothetical protein